MEKIEEAATKESTSTDANSELSPFPIDRPANQYVGATFERTLNQKFWSRVFARWFDTGVIYGTVISGAVSLLLGKDGSDLNQYVFAVIVASLSVVLLEPLMIKFFGNTPGKFIMAIRVVSQENGGTPSYMMLLRRALLVVLHGCWLHIPIFVLFGAAALQSRMRKGNTATWDKFAGTSVQYNSISLSRFVISASCIFIINLLIFVAGMMLERA